MVNFLSLKWLFTQTRTPVEVIYQTKWSLNVVAKLFQ